MLLRGTATRCVTQQRGVTQQHWKYGEVERGPFGGAWMGPSMHRTGEDVPNTDYPGNLKSPNWLLGENGDEIAAKCREVFQGWPPADKKITDTFRMRVAPGKASAGPPIAQVFAQMGGKPIEFVKEFNDKTAGIFAPDPEMKLKVYVRFFEDKTYHYKIMPPTTAWLVRKAAKLPSVGRNGLGAGTSPAVGGRWAGYLTLQQLYHVAAIANTWDHYPDWYPLELRVDQLVENATTQGICVLGVTSSLPPMLGKSDEEQYAEVREKKEKWTEDRLKQMDRNPLERLPWANRVFSRNVEGFDIVDKPDNKSLIKDAQAIDKKFQSMIDVKESKKQRGTVLWQKWKETGQLFRKKEEPEAIEQRHIEQNKSKRVGYLLKRYPSVMQRHRHYRAMWFSDDWEAFQDNGDTLGGKLR